MWGDILVVRHHQERPSDLVDLRCNNELLELCVLIAAAPSALPPTTGISLQALYCERNSRRLLITPQNIHKNGAAGGDEIKT